MLHTTYIGIDVGKSTLQVAIEKKNIALPNDKLGIKKLIADLKKLKQQNPTTTLQVVLEATAGYEMDVMAELQREGIGVSRINGTVMRNFARATMKHAKTDKIDAAQIKLFGERMTPKLSRELNAIEVALNKRVHRHLQLKEFLQIENNRLEHHCDKQTTDSIKRTIKFLEGEKERNQKAIYELEKTNQELKIKSALLSEMSGIGKLTAVSILGLLPEIGDFKRGQAASMCGLAPHNRDSGSSLRGHRFTGGGRKEIKEVLYMPALAAVRHDPVFKPYYARLIAQGKKPLIALVAVMRRLIEKCNAKIKSYYREQIEKRFCEKNAYLNPLLQIA